MKENERKKENKYLLNYFNSIINNNYNNFIYFNPTLMLFLKMFLSL